jgi:hypothetical protein
MKPQRLILATGLFVAIWCVAVPAGAVPINNSYSLDNTLFGHLNQADTGCPNEGCGPTAAVNSFVWLQNKKPALYDTLLTSDGLVATADALVGPDFMDTDCAACGTGWEQFIFGKRRWIEGKAPNRTSYGAQSEFAWNHRGDLVGDQLPRPGFVQDSTVPTWQFIFQELTRGEDIEILLQRDGVGGVNHYITVTELRWVDQNGDGIIQPNEGATIGFIDPAGGVFRSRSISQGGAGQRLQLDYSNDGTLDSHIGVVVTESPAPAPAALVLVVLGLAASMAVRAVRARSTSR